MQWIWLLLTQLRPLVPRAEIDGDIGDSHVGLQARMMSQAMRKLSLHLLIKQKRLLSLLTSCVKSWYHVW